MAAEEARNFDSHHLRPMSSPELLAAFERQAGSCRRLGANFTGDVVETLADELHRGRPLAELLADWPRDAWADAVPLRLCGALHALALAEDSPLSALYPPRATTLDRVALVRQLDAALSADRAHFERMLQQPPQTNEIGRSAVLLGGFAEVARTTQRPLALLEIGASAGLNMRWDRFRYELGTEAWGDPASPVRIRSKWQGAPPVLPPAIEVASRAACDAAPLDPRSEADQRCLLAYVWPEQLERVGRLKAALELARFDGLSVERADAAQWLERQLSTHRPGLATVVYHSIVWQYLANPTKEDLRAIIERAGSQATTDAPLARLAFEFEVDGHPPELILTQWPGGARRRLATAHPHGASVDWSAIDHHPAP